MQLRWSFAYGLWNFRKNEYEYFTKSSLIDLWWTNREEFPEISKELFDLNYVFLSIGFENWVIKLFKTY